MHSLDDVKAYLKDSGVVESEEEWDEREQFIFDAMIEIDFPFDKFCEKIKRVIIAERKFIADVEEQKNPGKK